MSGVNVVGALLRTYDPLISVVAPGSIKAGSLPEKVALPAILLRSISQIDRQPLKRSGYVRATERIEVTVRAASYREQRALIKLIRRCGDNVTIPEIEGVFSVSILTAGTGPDLSGPNNTFERAQDFRVSFDEPL